MATSYIRFRLARARHKFERVLAALERWLQNYIRRHIYGGWKKLGVMRNEFTAWILIILISIGGVWQGFAQLDNHWLTPQPKSGGEYREGLVGHVRQVNPLFVDNSATSDVTDLVFSKLVRQTAAEAFAGDLAESWEISTDRRTYTFRLRSDVLWHDGVAFTAEDVAFTFRLIQNPDTRSTAAGNWDGVVVNAIDDMTVQFLLPASYNGFLSTLSRVGIVPEHVLADRQAKQLRIDQFNQRPIGTGPFILEYLDITSDTIRVERNESYFEGSPYLEAIVFSQYDDAGALSEAYAKRQLDGLSQIDPARVEDLEDQGLTIDRHRLPAYAGAFFNTARPELSDPVVRRALGQAIDRSALVHEVLHDEGSVAHYPIPAQYPGFNGEASKVTHDPAAAQASLKDKFSRSLKLMTVNTGIYPEVARRLSDTWREAGVQVEVLALDSYSLQQNYIRPREYDILLYGQDIGGDSDMFSFWHSSQAADPGLNVSAYKNAAVDQLIEQARFGKDPAFRDGKYRDFVTTWSQDVPALLLYSPYYLYAHTDRLVGQESKHYSSSTDRFYKAHLWALRSEMVPKKAQ